MIWRYLNFFSLLSVGDLTGFSEPLTANWIMRRKPLARLIIYNGVNPRAQDSSAQDSMTNYLYFHTRDFSRFFTYCVKYETVSTNMYTSRVNSVLWIQRIKSVSRNRWSLSLWLKDPRPWCSWWVYPERSFSLPC